MPWTTLIGSGAVHGSSSEHDESLGRITCAVLVDFDGTVVQLGQGNHFDVIAVAVLPAFPRDVVFDILGDVLAKEVGIVDLEWQLSDG